MVHASLCTNKIELNDNSIRFGQQVHSKERRIILQNKRLDVQNYNIISFLSMNGTPSVLRQFRGRRHI